MAVARHWMTIHLERPSPGASRDLPGRLGWKHPWARRPAPSLFGLAPGGVCPAAAVAGSAVRSCRTISPLRRGKPRSRYLFCGTVPGVAPAGRYPAPCFHGARTFLPRALSGLAAAVIRPAGGTTGRRWAGRGQMMVWRAVYGRDAIVSGAGTWGIAGEAVPAASGVVASRGLERVARALPSAGIEGGWSKAPNSARGRRDFGRTQGASKPAVPAGQLPEGARVVMPPGPCVPFPGAGVRFPRPAGPPLDPHPRPPSRPGPQAGRALGL